MTLHDLPLPGSVRAFGADDRAFDLLLLCGPLVVLLIGLLGRSSWTELVAVAYVAAFVGTVVHR